MKSETFKPDGAVPMDLSGLTEEAPSSLEQGLRWQRGSTHFTVIDGRRLERECFTRSMGLLYPDILMTAYESIERCLDAPPLAVLPDVVILRVDQDGLSEPHVLALIRRLVERVAPMPVVLLSDKDDVAQMIEVLDCGVSGCISASLGLDAIIEALKLVSAGGFLLTSQGLSALRQVIAQKVRTPEGFGDELTPRQAAIAEALRQGKSNKTIAYNLNMCENTVKVHVRNILKKLRVTNRTEAAFKLNVAQARH